LSRRPSQDIARMEVAMAKRCTLLVGLIAMGILLAVGPAAAGTVKVGGHAGLSIPNIRGNENDIYTKGFTSRQGPFFGLFAEFGVVPHVSIVTELNYCSQGGQQKGMQLITTPPPGLPTDMLLYANFVNETVLDYVEVPLLLRGEFGRSVRFFLNAGPYAGYLVKAKAETSGSSLVYLDEAGTMPIVAEPISFDASTDVMDSLRRWNGGLLGGGGVKFAVGPGDIVLEAHFQLGLITIQKDVATSGATKTGAVVMSAGYAF
jgi:Outer membrane protein beta-barrel domain